MMCTQAAQRAERHRKAAKSEYYRQQVRVCLFVCVSLAARHSPLVVLTFLPHPQQYRDATFDRQRQEREILMEKHGLSPPKDSSKF